MSVMKGCNNIPKMIRFIMDHIGTSDADAAYVLWGQQGGKTSDREDTRYFFKVYDMLSQMDKKQLSYVRKYFL